MRGLLTWAWWCAASAAAAQVGPAADPVRLQIRWGGGEAASWQGHIALDGGALADLRVVDQHVDSAGSIWLANHRIDVRTLSPHTHAAIEATAFANGQAELRIDLSAPHLASPIHARVPLADLHRGPYELKLDERGNSLTVEKQAPSALQVLPERKSLIFQPGERCTFEIRAALEEAAPGTRLDIATTLSAVNGNKIEWRDEQRLAVPPDKRATLAIAVPMPRADGVYRIRVAAHRPSGFRDTFRPLSPAPWPSGASTLS